MVRIARWFIDITLDAEVLRWWNGTGSTTLGGFTYTGLGTRWITPKSLKRKASLKSEKISLSFDASKAGDGADPIGYLVDQKWRNRQVRIRRLAWDVGDGPDDGDVLEDERGIIRNLPDSRQKGRPATLKMEIDSGAIAYLERRMETRTPASQKAVFPDDKAFDLIAQLEGVTLPWRTKHKKAGTVQRKLQEEYEPYPRELALGRFVTSGSFVAAFVNGEQKKYAQDVYAIADHRINKLDKLWVNGVLVRDTALTHGVKTLIRLEGDKGEDRCWITFYDGRIDQTANAYLVGAASEWTTDHKMTGVAYFIIEHLWDEDLPEDFSYRVGGEGALLYDRRADTTAGGSGSQRWDDPATWVYSANAMVAIDHYRMGMRILSGDTAIWFGVGEVRDAVPYSEFEYLADHCDDAIPLKAGGTQKRYEANGILSAENSHDKNLEKLAQQMAARAIDQGGRIAIRPPITRSSVITLTDDDLIRDSESEIDPGGRIDGMINTVDGQFIDPANDWKKNGFPKVRVDGYIVDDNGEISKSLSLDLENSGERGQRIAKLTIEDSRRILEQTETYGVKARVILPGEWFIRESVGRGFPAGKYFIAEEVERYVDGSIKIKATEVDPTQLVWDEDTAVAGTTPPALPSVALVALTVPSIAVEPITMTGTTGASTTAVRLTHAAYTTFIGDQIEVELAYSDGASAPGPTGESALIFIPGKREVVQAFIGIPPSTEFVIRFRARSGERASAWSGWQVFTTLESFSIGLIAGRTPEEIVADIDSNALDVAFEFLNAAAWRASTEALLYVEGNAVGPFVLDLTEIVDDNVLSLSLLGTRNGGNTAWILSGATVVNNASGVSGKTITTIRTEHDNNTADIVEVFESIDGLQSRWAVSLNVSGYVVGLEATNSGVPETSSFIIVAPNFAIIDPGNSLVAPFSPFAVTAGVVRMYSVEVDTIKANTITTNKLVDNSITNAVQSTDSSTRAVPTGYGDLEVDAIVYSKSSSGSYLDISWNVVQLRTGTSQEYNFELELFIDGVSKRLFNHYQPGQFGHTHSEKKRVSGIAAGSRTITLKARAGLSYPTGISNCAVYLSDLDVQEVKK